MQSKAAANQVMCIIIGSL